MGVAKQQICFFSQPERQDLFDNLLGDVFQESFSITTIEGSSKSTYLVFFVELISILDKYSWVSRVLK